MNTSLSLDRLDDQHIAVVIPCFRTAETVEEVVSAVPSGIRNIICVDDASDDGLPEVLARLAIVEPRVEVIRLDKNRGVGGATITGYRRAIELGATVIVKVDSDLQMNPAFIPALAAPILAGEADYVKGNRFFDIDEVQSMPAGRLIGNAGLSLISRLSTGYWDLSDPTNGFTAIDATVAALLPLDKLHKRYFFESDLLFRLNSFGARVIDQPLETRYGKEVSGLSTLRCLLTFPFLHARNFLKRVGYNYFLRGFDVASLNLLAGLIFVFLGLGFGVTEWLESSRSGLPATAGTVMLSAAPILIGFQMLLAFLQHDVARTPRDAIHPRLQRRRMLKSPTTRSMEKDA